MQGRNDNRGGNILDMSVGPAPVWMTGETLDSRKVAIVLWSEHLWSPSERAGRRRAPA